MVQNLMRECSILAFAIWSGFSPDHHGTHLKEGSTAVDSQWHMIKVLGVLDVCIKLDGFVE